MSIGDQIKARRLALGMTLEQVGNAVGVGKSTVRKWEQGMIKSMKSDKIEALAAILHMDPVDFILQKSPEESTVDPAMVFPAKPENEREYKILLAFRAADERSQDDALQMLLAHKK